jgi:hypothetical protein
MQDAFSSGLITDIILGLMALELLAFFALRRRMNAGPSPLEIVASLAAGLFLILALRTALTGGPWEAIAAALLGSLVAHVTDQWLRWTRTLSDTPGAAP